VQIIERIMLFLLLILLSGAGQGIFAVPSASTSSAGQPVTQAALALIYLGLFLFLLRKFRKTALALILKEKWTLILCLWALASTLWSVGPSESLRHGLALVGTSMAGLYVGMRYEPRQQLKMFALVIGLGAIASLVAGLLFPGIGVTVDGSWQGIYFPKNSLGRMMALGVLCFAVQYLGQRRHRVARAGMFLLCCALLFLSKSATAVVVTFLMLAILPFRKMLLLRTRPLIGLVTVLFLFVVSAGWWAIEYSDKILLALGRTSSLTGRIPLWQLVIQEIAVRPIQGYGFTAFWTSWEGERVSDTVAWDVAVPHAHNGFLEMWLGVGIIGLAILLISMWRNFVSGMRVARARPEIDQAWPLLLLAFTVLYNLTETSWPGVNSLLWMAYVANSFWLVRTIEEEKHAVELHEELEPAYSA
jgi:exopolysaccharide production protein ExoQ